MDLIITTVRNYSATEEIAARQLAQQFQVPYAMRDASLADMKNKYQVNHILVFKEAGSVIHTPGGKCFFHLSMAELRIKNILNGKHDHMVTAMALEPGMSVLDCTLGLGTDAIVASFVTGRTGTVTALESSPVIAWITQQGLLHFTCDNTDINQAMRQIQVHNLDCYDYLMKLPEKSFDIVYFDPMFRHPIPSSSNLKPLRYLADSRSLEDSLLKLASRVAKKKVVIKETHHSGEFQRLGIANVVGGKYSSIQYGVLAVGG